MSTLWSQEDCCFYKTVSLISMCSDEVPAGLEGMGQSMSSGSLDMHWLHVELKLKH